MVQVQESLYFLHVSFLFSAIQPLGRQDFQEAKPYGMFDKPHVFLSSALLIPVLGLNITGWMVFSRTNFGGLGKLSFLGGSGINPEAGSHVLNGSTNSGTRRQA